MQIWKEASRVMQTSLFLAFLTALIFHVVGLAVMSFGWQAWREAWPRPEPPATTLIAVTPILEPTPPPLPETPPEPVSMPDVDSVPEPVPATPPLVLPIMLPKQVEPPPPKPVEPPRRKPAPVAPVTHTPPPRLPPARERAPRPAPVQREAKGSPPPGLRNEPQGSAGSGSPGTSPAPAMPVEATPQPAAPAAGAGVGPLFAHGDMPVAPGSGGSGGEGAGGGTGPGRGGGAGSGTGGVGGTSARPIGGYQVKPRYPESARRRGIEGTVLLKMRITAQGRVEDVQVVRSAGYPDLDESAMEAVRRWRFEPARRNGEPVAEDAVLLPVVFQLQ